MRIESRGILVAAGLVAASAFVGCHETPGTDQAKSADTAPSSVPLAETGRAAVRDAGAGIASADAGIAGPANAASAPVASPAPTALPVSVARISAATIPPASLKVAVTANNAFATALFGHLRAHEPDKNLLAAPISATLTLGMAYAGATGRTRTEMATALHFGAEPVATILEGQNALSQALSARGPDAFAVASKSVRESTVPLVASDYALEIVNSVWGEASYRWKTPFLNTLAADYGAGVYARDFQHQSEPARLEINAWVSAQTSDKINGLLPAGTLTKETRLVLVNALHLKFPWQAPFEATATAAAPFTRADRKQVSVPFMHRQAQLAYLDDGAAQIVSLPLVGRQLALIIALPHVGVALADYARALRAGSPALTSPMKSALVALALPKVTFTSETFSLGASLRQLGMVQAFDKEHARFDGMAESPPGNERLAVADVLQKTMISLEETGVEAAAATAVVMMTATALRVAPAPVPIPMIVNRPYLIAVVDVPTGAVLLVGQINDPSDAGSK